MLTPSRAKDNARWALQSYMGYAYEAFSTATPEGDPEDSPEGWSGDVNTNVQWCKWVCLCLFNCCCWY